MKRKEMAAATLSMAFKLGYQLTLMLGSHEDGQYLRADDSLEVTGPEYRILLQTQIEELVDFLEGQK